MKLNDTTAAKELIKEAFISLYKDKKITDIRVTEIANRAGINRGTFYLYYTDIYDLRKQMEDELLFEMKKIVTKERPKNIFSMNRHQIIDYFTPALEFIYRNRFYFIPLLRNNTDDYFKTKIKEIMTYNIEKGMSEKKQSEKKYAVKYMVAANLAVIIEWLEHDESLKPEEISAILERFMSNGALV